MIGILTMIVGGALIVQAFIGLSFFVSSVWEREPKATIFSLIQFLGMSGLVAFFFYLLNVGLFETTIGIFILWLAIVSGALCLFFLIKKSPPNKKALQGTEGLIAGEVKRFDERDQVFARNRALRPGSEQYKSYYKMRPENEAFDIRRV